MPVGVHTYNRTGSSSRKGEHNHTTLICSPQLIHIQYMLFISAWPLYFIICVWYYLPHVMYLRKGVYMLYVCWTYNKLINNHVVVSTYTNATIRNNMQYRDSCLTSIFPGQAIIKLRLHLIASFCWRVVNMYYYTIGKVCVYMSYEALRMCALRIHRQS